MESLEVGSLKAVNKNLLGIFGTIWFEAVSFALVLTSAVGYYLIQGNAGTIVLRISGFMSMILPLAALIYFTYKSYKSSGKGIMSFFSVPTTLFILFVLLLIIKCVRDVFEARKGEDDLLMGISIIGFALVMLIAAVFVYRNEKFLKYSAGIYKIIALLNESFKNQMELFFLFFMLVLALQYYYFCVLNKETDKSIKNLDLDAAVLIGMVISLATLFGLHSNLNNLSKQNLDPLLGMKH